MSFQWDDIAVPWREAFKTPEVDTLLDEHLCVLLDATATENERAAARGAIDTVLRLQSLPDLVRARKQNKSPVVPSAQSWRQRLLATIRTHYPSAEEMKE